MFGNSRRFQALSPTQHSKEEPAATTRSIRTNSSSSSANSLSRPRQARFVEPKSTGSTKTTEKDHRLPFSKTPKVDNAPTPSYVGFGYVSPDNETEMNAAHPVYTDGPLKSAMKTPGTAGPLLNPLSATFREEQFLDIEEKKTEILQAKDLKVKTRVRLAKMVLRGVSFSCSLIVLSMLSTTFSIINATHDLPPRNNLPVWATGNRAWPQVTVLVISCVSLALSIVIIASYWRGGHRRAMKTARYYTIFAVSYFFFSTGMWLVGAGVLHGSKATGNGQDIWGWSCKDNERSQLFKSEVHYALVCRLQNWSLMCCLIEVVVEVITISIYGIVFHRFYSKHRLRKSMNARDRARSDLYLAQLRFLSAPNTPGFTADQTYRPPRAPVEFSALAEHELSQVQYASPPHNSLQSGMDAGTFVLQSPPIRIHHTTPRQPQEPFEAAPLPPEAQHVNEHVDAAPGEQIYDAVPIPTAYPNRQATPAYAEQGPVYPS